MGTRRAAAALSKYRQAFRDPEFLQSREDRWRVNRVYQRYISKRRDAWQRQGMDPDEAQRVWERREGCDLCGGETAGRDLAVDHDHKTGRVRGVLCATCNLGLGLLGDQPINLFLAWAYVTDPGEDQENTR